MYPEDDGLYTCVASNSAGEAKTTAKMFVKGKCWCVCLYDRICLQIVNKSIHEKIPFVEWKFTVYFRNVIDTNKPPLEDI